jgi:hypothetical protein
MTQQTPPRPDPIGDFQRWLVKSGARNLGREVRGNLRKTFGRPSEEDVWSQATREEPNEPPECEWCPICRAARKYRDSSGPGVGGHLTGAGDAFASVVSDAFSAFESALSVVRPPSAPKTASGSPAPSAPKTPAEPKTPSEPGTPARPVWPLARPSAEPEPAPSAGSAAAASESVAAAGAPAAADEDPVTAGPAAADPVAGGPVTAGPAAADPVAGGPVTAGPAAADPVAGDPVTGDPVIGGAVTAEPDAWDLATEDGQGEPVDDPDHRG